MSLEEIKAVPRRLLMEVFSKGRTDIIDEIFHQDFISHTTHGDLKGTESMKGTISMNQSAFGDLRFTIDDQIAEGDKVATRWTFRTKIL